MSKIVKIVIGGEDGYIMSFCHCADKKIRIGSLNTMRLAGVEEFGSPFITPVNDFKISKHVQMIMKNFKVRLFPNTGQEFLTNRTDQLSPKFRYQFLVER